MSVPVPVPHLRCCGLRRGGDPPPGDHLGLPLPIFVRYVRIDLHSFVGSTPLFFPFVCQQEGTFDPTDTVYIPHSFVVASYYITIEWPLP